jgi:hypothetical protein
VKQGLRRRLVEVVVLALVVCAALGAEARGAARPPAPKGVAILAAGQTPHVCGPADGKFGATGYGTVSGVYYSSTANAWLSAPLCYPLWGNLEASAPQIVAGGGKATVVATPNQGSNSAEWATKPPGAISWQPAGTPVKGSCGPTKLTCTVTLPAAGPEWQWLLFHVSMPRTYFIDSQGSSCVGQHACAGTGTQAWAYVAIPPKGTKVPPKKKDDTYSISGRVRQSRCSASACSFVGLTGVVVSAQGPGGPVQVTTGASGAYKLDGLEAGTWNVKPTLASTSFSPDATAVVVRKQSLVGIDFQTCAASHTTLGIGRGAEAFCRLLSVEAVPTQAADPQLKKLPVKLDYQGIGWDPKGGPIAISFGGKPITKIPQASGFKKRLYAPEWPERDNILQKKGGPVGCRAALTAAQSGVTRIQNLSTPAAAFVIFADGDRVLRTGDVVCGGELFVLENSAGTVLITDGQFSSAQIGIYQPLGGINQAVTVQPGKPLCVALFPAARGHVTIVRSAANGVYQGHRGTGPCP